MFARFSIDGARLPHCADKHRNFFPTRFPCRCFAVKFTLARKAARPASKSKCRSHGEQIKLRRGMFLGLGLFSILAAAGALKITWLSPVAEPAALTLEAAAERATLVSAGASAQFSICGSVRRTCVVDGDTFWLDGVKIRIADIDTPEIGQPQCDREYQLGMRATYRLVELLNAGPFELRMIGERDEDRFGRKLRVVIRGGRSLGDQLVSEGLARTWSGRREPWC